MKTTVYIEAQPMAPSKNKIPTIMHNQFQFRKTRKFIGNNEIIMALMEEPIWWNRPLPENATTLVKQEPDGIFSYNFPLYIPKKAWKSDYNLLLNKNNFPVATHIQFDSKLTDPQIAALSSMSKVVVTNTLVALGLPKYEITQVNNDLLIHGKKFFGQEAVIADNVYDEDTLITFKYLEEKDIFDRLSYGKAGETRKITGILDEFPDLCNREQFIDEYLKQLRIYLSGLDFIEIEN